MIPKEYMNILDGLSNLLRKDAIDSFTKFERLFNRD